MDRRSLLRVGAAVPVTGVVGAAPLALGGYAPTPGPFADGTIGLTMLGDSRMAGSTSDAANGIAGGSNNLVTGNGCRGYLYDWLSGPNETHGLQLFGTRWSGSRGLHHEGYPGETIGQIAARVQGGLLYGREPQYCVIMAGANDFGDQHLRTWDQALADMSALVDAVLAAAPWTRVVLCEEPLMSGAISHDLTKSTWQQQPYNAGLPDLAAGKNGRVTVARSAVIDQSMLDGSGVHCNDLGYRWLAFVIYQALRVWLGHDVGAPDRYMTNIPTPPGSPRPVGIL